jgi:hypothetical protein
LELHLDSSPLGMGRPWRRATYPSLTPAGTRYSLGPANLFVFSLDFFHSLARLGCGGDVGGDDSWADPSDLLRDLFFVALAFEPLDRDGFILQDQGVFTRICLGATLVASCGGTRGFSISHAAVEAIVDGNWNRSIQAAATARNEIP